jgi:predicted nucleic acid-binding protein
LTVFVDSGGWLSVMIEADQYHAVGSAYFRALIDIGAVVVTTDYVLDEVVTRLRYDVGHAKAAEFLALVREAVSGGAVRLRRIDEPIWNKAEAVFLRYADARLSFTDCTSFALLSEQPVDEVFGYDAHFEMMGYTLQPSRTA